MTPAYEHIHHSGPVHTKTTHPYSYDPIRYYHAQAHGDPESCYSDRMASWDYDKWRSSIATMNGRHGGPHLWRMENGNQAQELLRLYFDAPELVLLDLIEWCNVSTGYNCFSFSFIRVPDESKPLSPGLPVTEHDKQVTKWDAQYNERSSDY